jgi:hypothetical protein
MEGEDRVSPAPADNHQVVPPGLAHSPATDHLMCSSNQTGNSEVKKFRAKVILKMAAFWDTATCSLTEVIKLENGRSTIQ